MKINEVLDAAKRIGSLGGLSWLYWKCYLEGVTISTEPAHPMHLLLTREFLTGTEDLHPRLPLDLKFEAFLHKMIKQKKDKEANLHPNPNPLGLQSLSHTSYLQEKE